MIVTILKDIFENDSNNRELDKLWYIIEERHKLFMNDEDDIDALMDSKWFEEQREIDKEIIRDLIVWSLQNIEHLKNGVIISGQQNNNYFPIKEAQKYLIQPFCIIFENSNNDSCFFDALLANFPKESEKIREHKNENWMEYGMAGGSAEDIIETKLKSYSNPVFTKEKYKYLRCFVLADSDKKYKEMPFPKEKLKKFLEEHEVKYHFLEKREMENYLPDEAFEEIIDPKNKDFIEAYLKLSDKQKDYFDIQNGFPDKNFDSLEPEIKTLFRDISEENRKFFRKNSLKTINSDSKNNFKSEFPKLFLSKKVTKENLLQKTSHQNDPNELKNILKKITELL